jgi:tetratricopeptide (TPR) repeat protein
LSGVDIRCKSCGRPATEGAHFRRVRKWLLRRAVFYCPACFARRGRGGHWLLLLVFLAWTALGVTPLIVAAALQPADGGPHGADLTALLVSHSQLQMRWVGWLMLNVSLFFVLLAPLIAVHEVGHALGAWLLGLRVFSVTIGCGPLLAAWRWRGTRWELRAIVGDGTTSHGYPTLRFFRLKFFLAVLAGPLANGALLAAVLWWRPPAALADQLAHWPQAPGPLPLLVLVAGGAVLLLVSLVPLRFHAEGGHQATDGWQLLRAPFLSREVRENTHALYFALEGGQCVAERRYDDALRWYEQGLEHNPQCPLNRYGVSCALLGMRRFEEAERGFAELRARKELGPGFLAMVADALAALALDRVIEARCQRPPDPGPLEEGASARLAALLEQGERYSQEALEVGRRLAPQLQWSMMGTYGCLLVEQGEFDEGATILRLARGEVAGAGERAYCLCYLAVAAARQGRREEARAAAEQARRLWPDCPALERAEWELAQGP